MATAAQTTDVAPETFTLIKPGERLFTLADVAAMPENLPSGSVSYELHHGRLMPMSPPGATHGNLQSRIGAALSRQGEERDYGKAYTEVGIVLGRNPDDLKGADAAFIAKQSLPARESPEGYLETIPELIVEIRSKNDTNSEVAEKVADYLRAGVKVAWVVDGDRENVTEYRPNIEPRILTAADTITCDDIIPGFLLVLTDLFRD
jgi:Uma2 family endonuclease